MEKPWLGEAALVLDEAGAASLIRERWPELDGPLTHVGRGWDVDVWRVHRVAFRFPRRELGVKAVAKELSALPSLMPLLRETGVAIPAPRYIGEPSARYSATFYGHDFIEGTPADRLGVTDADRAAVAPSLGVFLRSLHALDPAAAELPAMPRSPSRDDTARQAERALERLPAIARAPHPRIDELVAAARVALATPPPRADPQDDRVCHGDLYARHLILSPERCLVGIIDWGDVGLGDRAIDLGGALSFLTPAVRPAFWSAYGEVDAETMRRARHAALSLYGVSLLAYALDVGDEPLVRESLVALENALG